MKCTWIILETDDACTYLGGKTVADDTQWFSISIEPNSSTKQIGIEIAKAFEEQGYKSEPVALGLDSANVYAASVTLDRGNKTALPFELEEFSPYAAEDMTCDAQTSGNSTLGCWIETKTYRDLVADLESCGLQVTTVAATLLFACQEFQRQQAEPFESICIEASDGLHLFVFHNKTLRTWKRLPNNPEALERETQLCQTQGSMLLISSGGFQPPSSIKKHTKTITANLNDSAAQLASNALQQRAEPWFDFYRDSIVTASGKRTANKSALVLLAGLCVLLLSLATSALVLTERYNKKTALQQTEQANVFRDLFPGERVPVGIRRRLRIRAEQLTATRKTPVELPTRGIVLSSLHKLLESLPQSDPNSGNEMRYHIRSIRIGRQEVTLNGSVREHGSADVIATAMSDRGFKVSPPRTENLPSRGVSLSLVATHQVTPEEGEKE